jgi:hypothetical protein
MTKRVRKANKSPEDQQESGRLPRARTRNMKTQGNLQEPGSLQDCQVPRIQKPKSLEDWHNLRVKPQEDDSTIFRPTRRGDRERKREERW